ncbi:MAG: nucleotide exchange factor GrpE [Pseudomonadota bacterium]
MSHRDAAAAAKEETMSDTQHTPPFPDTEPASMNGAAASADPSEALARVAELEAKNVELADAYLRAKAEMENVRRRADDEIAKSRKFAVESFAESLLPVCDSLHAAIAAQSAGQGTPEQLLEGVQATLRQLSQALERNKVVEVNPPAGTKFDPHQHQAIGMVPADQDPNTVVNVLQKGYLIAERVLRPALVMVAAPK